MLEPAWQQGPVIFRVLACRAGACAPLFERRLDPAAQPGERAWQDQRVSLAAHEGERVSFRFETEQPTAAPDSFTLPVWSSPAVVAPGGAPDAPDLLLVSIDTLRADHLPCYGYPRDTAPFIDSGWARRGTLFEHAVAAATATAPSHMTIFTSLAPSVHGVRGNLGGGPLDAAFTTLAERLRDAGYATGAVTEGGALAAESGFARGFDRYLEIRLEPRGEREPVEETLARAIRWLEAHRDRRFFLFVHTYQVHTPYEPPPAYADLFREPLPGATQRAGVPQNRLPEHYDREIRFVDDQLRAFEGELERRGLARDALRVLTSDHGEGFLEHGLLAHSANIYDEVLRVPLVFAGPGIPRGRRVAAAVGLVDLMPTLLELLGQPAPASAMGRSLAPFLRGEAAGEPPPRPLFSEAWGTRAWGPDGVIERVPPPSFAVRAAGGKLIRLRREAGPRFAYFNLERDPGERIDRYDDPEAGERVAALRAMLERYPTSMAERRAALTGQPLPPEPENAPPLEPEREQALRALGYVD